MLLQYIEKKIRSSPIGRKFLDRASVMSNRENQINKREFPAKWDSLAACQIFKLLPDRRRRMSLFIPRWHSREITATFRRNV